MLAHLLVLWILLQSAWCQPVPADPNAVKKLTTTRVKFSPFSIWSPFCTEKQLFEPYVQIWSGGVEKRFIKSRGPGFIDVRDMKDIFICTNGIAMFYYANTKAMGDILEEGELRWAPHYCQLHNPTCGPGTIQPRRTLKAILLIGHPKDYRKPAMQMFVTPYYNDRSIFATYNQGWVNLTSYLMVNHYGECIVERGNEKTLIRINVNKPKYEDEFEEDLAFKNDARQSFCRFDAARMLTQRRPMADLVNSKKTQIVEFAARHDYYDYFIFKNRTRFLGCLRYPTFNQKQHDIVMDNYYAASEQDQDKSTIKLESLAKIDELTPMDHANNKSLEFPFWHVVVKGKERYKLFAVNALPSNTTKEDYETALKEYTEAKQKGDKAAIEAAGEKEYAAYMQSTLYPFHMEYATLYDYTNARLNTIRTAWQDVINVVKEKDLETKLALLNTALQNASMKAQDKRANPYDYKAADDYEDAKDSADGSFSLIDAFTDQIGKLITEAEVLKINYMRNRHGLETLGRKFRAAWLMAERRKTPVFTPTKRPEEDHVLSLNNHDDAKFSSCDYLPGRTETCHLIRPMSSRAYMLYKARVGKGPKWEKEEDEWRGRVLEHISDIFIKTCPYIPNGIDLATGVNGIVKSYLLKEPNNTGYEKYVRGARLYENLNVGGDLYMEEIYNDTRGTMGENLRKKRKFWNYIITTLEECKRTVKRVVFVKGKDDASNPQILLKTYHSGNGTHELIPTDQIHMIEQVDKEYILNWAIDTNWKMFATVLGSCFKSFYDRLSLIASQFYSMYVQDFLHPIRQIWMSHRDNVIFRVIFGRYFGNGKADKWINNCMEAVYITGEERTHRPLRWLLVNQFSELNFFVSGPMAGSSGAYFENLT